MKISTSKIMMLLVPPLSACGGQMVGWPMADEVPPTVSSTTPIDSATSVALNAPVAATFSEAMDPETVTGASFLLVRGSAPVSATVTYTGVTALFAPSLPLEPDSLYTATVTSDVTDVAGNPMIDDYVWSFSTGAVVDDLAPWVIGTYPDSDAIDVAANGSVISTFSEPMDPESITTTAFTLQDGSVLVDGAVIGTGATAMFDPAADLHAGTEYTATVTTEATDLAGNSLVEDYTWNFTIGSDLDTNPPIVIFTNPEDMATSVAVDAKVSAAFSEAMDPLTVTTANFELTGPGTTPVAGTVVYDLQNPVGTFTPTNPLVPNTHYTATITTGAADLAGNPLVQDYVWTFAVAGSVDALAPTVILTNPSNLAVDVPVDVLIDAAFSEKMDPTTITSSTFKVTGPGTTPVNGSVVYDLQSPIGTFTPVAALVADTTYTATVTTGAKDLAGNPLAQDYVWTFTIGAAGDTLAPTVIATDPLNLATNVPTSTKVHGAFSEAMDALSITSTTFKLAGPGTTPVLGSVSYDPLTVVGTFAPTVALLPNTTYTATITSGAKDLAGNPLVQDYVWTFATAALPSGLQPVNMGSLTTFVAVAGAGLTNSNSSGVTTLNGDVGLSPTATCLGDGSPCTLTNPVINGTLYANDPNGIAAKAKVDLTAAYVDAMSRPVGTTVNDITGMTLAPGVYTSGSTMSVAVGGTVILDGKGDANAVWIFQIGSSLTVNNNAQVLLVNGAKSKNVFWATFASSTLGSNVSFQGSVLAGASNSVGTDSVVVGRLLCTTGQITLLSNNITLPPL